MRRKRINVRESLRSSFKDGIFAACMAGVTDHYATPTALFLGATVQQVGLISALPNLLSSLSQFFSVRMIYWVGGRLKLLIRLVFTQALLIVCIAVLPLLEISHRVELLLILLILSAACGGLAGPAWGSLMSDYVPAFKRGRYFGWRNRTVGAVTGGSIVAALLGTFVGNPLTYPLFWYSTYEVGNLMLGSASEKPPIDLSGGIFQSSLEQLWPILKPMTLGSVPVGLALAALSYVLVKPMVDAYKHRRRRELELRASREALGAR